ncbi:MAG: hypothetical protein JO115_03755 [Pseudonocardiales bacterium]|nr:hypothetical protein [Pseudonocardiales bacterium]
MLPAGLYDRPVLEDALARWDFALVFVAVRAVQRPEPWSREVLGVFLGWEERRIVALETGRRPLVDVRAVVWVANQLGIPAGKLGFIHGVTVGGRSNTGREGSWVHRRDFVEHVAGLTVATAGSPGLDVDRATALLPQAEPTGTRHVGAADVAVIDEVTAIFVRQDFATGSGPVRDHAVTHLSSVLPLLDAQVSDALRPRLYLAIARLATQAGYLSYDSRQHDAARELWLIALEVTRTAHHPLGTDQTVFVLYDLAQQALELGRPDEALRLIYLGHATAAASPAVSAATISCLAGIQARVHAARGDVAGCDRALGQALEHFSSIDPAQESWADFLDEAHLASFQGGARYELALATRDPRAADRAVPLLRQAVEGFGPGYARARALYLPKLAGAHAIAGDIDTAVTLGHQAIDSVTAVHSPRAYGRLRVLNTALEPLHTSAGVAELRKRLRVTAV